MKRHSEIREYLRQARNKISAGLWGVWGLWRDEKRPQPTKTPFEVSPGLSIGTTSSTQPLARLSGYGHNCEANADYITILVNSIDVLLDDLDELEKENVALKELLDKSGGMN
jgi:hypothetical protein